ncbi:hypothetical protein HED60_07000 [Planctomycetales bacterium ZRK34]|nr:hypothetical protein HED60_07000 [Planctomycetales bacterium ZRK34]
MALAESLRDPGRFQRSAFTLVEMVISIVLVATVFIVAMNTVGASRTMMFRVADRAAADALAAQMTAEILALPYWSPVYHSGMGPNSEEAATGNRSKFDDADDYDDWSASPPQAKDGTEMTDYAGLTRTVQTPWVDPSDFQTERSYETGVKRITVQVKRGNVVLAERIVIKTVAWTELSGDAW